MTRRPVPGPSMAVVTAPGRGAIAVVRIWGDGALAVVDRAFRPLGPRSLADSPRGRLRVGRIGAGLGDEVVAVVGGVDPLEIEIQCHGGPSAVAMVVEALASGGARLRPPRAWARHSTGSAIRAEAATALAGAPTLRSAEILLDQEAGALDEALRSARSAPPDRAIAILDELIARSALGARLVEGWRVVLAGRPNVGKSRLLNALAGFDRAIVDPTPGTTRDVVTVSAAFDGWPVELADTAGLRATLDPIETQGVARALDRHRGADLVVVVLDGSRPLEADDHAILAAHPSALVVANKSDLPVAWNPAARGALAISAERGDAIETLGSMVARRLVPEPPEPGAGVPFRGVHARRLRAIRACLAAGDRDRAIRSLDRWVGPSGARG